MPKPTLALAWPAALDAPRAAAVDFVSQHQHVLPFLEGHDPSTIVDALAVLLVFLVFVLAFSRIPLSTPPPSQISTEKRKPGPRSVLLTGPSGSGKTALFSSLVYGCVPSTHTSQVDTSGWTVLGAPEPFPGEKVARSTAVRMIDTPGHPRLRARAHDFLPQADALVFCVDATTAARGANATTAPEPGSPLADVVDFFHTTLTTLATQRLRDETALKTLPPSLMVLFTRADLSPLLKGDASTQRKAQLLSRARTGFETALTFHRAALKAGTSSGGMTKLSGIDEIHVEGSKSLFGRIKAFFIPPPAIQQEEEDEFDYLSVGGRVDQLDPDVVQAGKVEFGLNALGTSRSWSAPVQGKDDRDLRVFLTAL